ncbi:hypothetical protein Q3G72_005374 [Acer saccharum]|nr:hypothetical protein Q3G72_005374 [Acer saccharum]
MLLMVVQVYIVYMGSLPEGEYSPSSHHLSILQEVVENNTTSVNDILIRSYKRSFNGFAAKLNEREQRKIASMEGVVSVFPSKSLQLQTTRSWDFMGFSETVKRNPTGESDVIIGVIDTGIWPELESFNDEGIGPIPKKWKGVCEGGANFTCNKKIIGARVYKKNESARDKIEGHGTHMASIAAGNVVKGVDFFGLARGNARGAVPSARIAVYKICFVLPFECQEYGLLAALDDAIADGIDILTISLTYATSTDLSRDEAPLVYGNVSRPGCPESAGRECLLFCLDEKLVKGKIVVCDHSGGFAEAYRAGATGSISPSYSKFSAVPLPNAAYALKNHEGDQVKAYMKSTKNPQAKILKSEVVKSVGDPITPDFSSRGPSAIIADIIKLHIVYMGSLQEGQYSPASTHLNMLQEVVGTSTLENILVRSYRKSFNGFAAKLTDIERQKLANMDGVVSIFPSSTLQLHTTRSWDFMGFNESVSRKRNIESNIIVGVFDTGIWPESESFSDEGFGPPPKKWKGACIGGQNFTCNNKIIGARYYLSDYPGTSTRDEEGHGSHTASTAAGNLVKDASFFGLAKGRARGGVPSARIAAYKVCYPEGCASADILSAFDDAIADGVDLITISFGHGNPSEYNKDPIAIGAFHAMAKGILTVNSAGNNGPKPSTTTSVAPWLFSVAASTTDRLILDNIILGNGKKIEGSSINPFNLGGKKLPLVRGKEVSSGSCTEEDAESCYAMCLDSSKVKGKIIMCDDVFGFDEAREAGAAGSVMKNKPSDEIPPTVSLPASAVFSKEYNAVLSYKNSTKNPLAEILKSETIKDFAAPIVTRFSSRGPNVIVPEILKPDISAPGLNILAAYSAIAPAFDYSSDEGGVRYKMMSGTSMACPHVTGTAAYVKTFHPEWSPSAIKSAIMTTGKILYLGKSLCLN